MTCNPQAETTAEAEDSEGGTGRWEEEEEEVRGIDSPVSVEDREEVGLINTARGGFPMARMEVISAPTTTTAEAVAAAVVAEAAADLAAEEIWIDLTSSSQSWGHRLRVFPPSTDLSPLAEGTEEVEEEEQAEGEEAEEEEEQTTLRLFSSNPVLSLMPTPPGMEAAAAEAVAAVVAAELVTGL